MGRTIWFKKQSKNEWRRNDGELKVLVSEKDMYNEILNLIRVGGTIKIWGVTHTYVIEVTIP